MIIKTQSEVTAAVLAELERAADPRFRQILAAAVGHLHGFVRAASCRSVPATADQTLRLLARSGQ